MKDRADMEPGKVVMTRKAKMRKEDKGGETNENGPDDEVATPPPAPAQPAPVPATPGAFGVSGIDTPTSDRDEEEAVDPTSPSDVTVGGIENPEGTTSLQNSRGTDGVEAIGDSQTTFVASAELVLDDGNDEEMQVLRQQANAFRILPVAAVRQEEAPEKEEEEVPSHHRMRWPKSWKVLLLGILFCSAVLSVAFVLGGADDDGNDENNTDVEVDLDVGSHVEEKQTLASAGYTKFLAAVEIADLWVFLEEYRESEGGGDKNFTLFAPSNEAWDSLPFYFADDDRDGRPDFKVHVRTLLINHVVRGTVDVDALVAGKEYDTLGGVSIRANTVPRASASNKTSIQVSPLFVGDGTYVVTEYFPEHNVLVHGFSGMIETSFLTKGPTELFLEYNLTETLDFSESAVSVPAINQGPVTSFALSNDAVDAMPLDLRETIRSDPVGWVSILLDYSLGYIRYSEDFVDGEILTTPSRETFVVSTDPDGIVYVTRRNVTARVIQKDLLHRTGVAHVIDTFFVPLDY